MLIETLDNAKAVASKNNRMAFYKGYEKAMEIMEHEKSRANNGAEPDTETK